MPKSRRNREQKVRDSKRAFKQRLRELGYDSYAAYLRSDHWREVKANHPATRCWGCGSDGRCELHHRTYKRLGAERPEDLLLLCPTCHSEAHRLASEGQSLWNACAAVRFQKQGIAPRRERVRGMSVAQQRARFYGRRVKGRL